MSAIDFQNDPLRLFIQAAKADNVEEADYVCLTDSNEIQIVDPPKRGCCGYARVSDVEKEANRRVWKLYRERLHAVYGEKRIDRICKRYDLNFQKNERKGNPLLVKHIVQIGVGVADLCICDLKAVKEKGEELSLCTPGRIQQLMKRLDPFHYIGKNPPPQELMGGPVSKWGYLFHDSFGMDKKRRALFAGMENLSPMAFIDRFGKAIVSHEMQEGTIIPAPLENGGVDYYKIHKKVGGAGLVAYALTPLSSTSGLQPMIVFRPTQIAIGAEDATESCLNDLEPKLGSIGYNDCREALEELMRDRSFFDGDWQRMLVVGYSLGGGHAQRFIKDQWRHLVGSWGMRAIFINDPSIDGPTAEAFAEEINKAGAIPHSTIQIYRTYHEIDGEKMKLGDPTHCGGEKHLGWGLNNPYFTVEIHNLALKTPKKLSSMQYHSLRLLDGSEEYNTRIDTASEVVNIELDNLNPARSKEIRWYESFRRSWIVQLGYYLLYFFYRVAKWFCELCGWRIYRTAKFEKRNQVKPFENLVQVRHWFET